MRHRRHSSGVRSGQVLIGRSAWPAKDASYQRRRGDRIGAAAHRTMTGSGQTRRIHNVSAKSLMLPAPVEFDAARRRTVVASVRKRAQERTEHSHSKTASAMAGSDHGPRVGGAVFEPAGLHFSVLTMHPVSPAQQSIVGGH